MKRRDFLKLLGACIVAPGAVIAAVKAKPQQYSVHNGRYYAWKHYYTTCHYKNDKVSREMLEKFRRAFKNTKFQKPCKSGCRRIIIYDEFDYITVDFLKRHKVNIIYD